jgi:hypothetical protein
VVRQRRGNRIAVGDEQNGAFRTVIAPEGYVFPTEEELHATYMFHGFDERGIDFLDFELVTASNVRRVRTTQVLDQGWVNRYSTSYMWESRETVREASAIFQQFGISLYSSSQRYWTHNFTNGANPERMLEHAVNQHGLHGGARLMFAYTTVTFANPNHMGGAWFWEPYAIISCRRDRNTNAFTTQHETGHMYGRDHCGRSCVMNGGFTINWLNRICDPCRNWFDVICRFGIKPFVVSKGVHLYSLCNFYLSLEVLMQKFPKKLIMLAMALLILLTACVDKTSVDVRYDEILVRVNNDFIYRERVELVYLDNEGTNVTYERIVMDSILELLVVQQAPRFGINLSDCELQDILNSFEAIEPEFFNEAVETFGIDELREKLRTRNLYMRTKEYVIEYVLFPNGEVPTHVIRWFAEENGLADRLENFTYEQFLEAFGREISEFTFRQ